MMKLLAIATVILTLCSTTAVSAGERETLEGWGKYKFGMSSEELYEIFGSNLKEMEEKNTTLPLLGRELESDSRIDVVDKVSILGIEFSVTLYLRNNKLISVGLFDVELGFANSDCKARLLMIGNTLESKHGAPDTMTSGIVGSLGNLQTYTFVDGALIFAHVDPGGDACITLVYYLSGSSSEATF